MPNFERAEVMRKSDAPAHLAIGLGISCSIEPKGLR